MRNADGAIIVYDVTSDPSFNAANYWLTTLRQVADEDICIYLLGNKYDLVKDIDISKRVNKEKINEFINKENLAHFTECSAKLNFNIKNTFDKFYKGKNSFFIKIIYIIHDYLKLSFLINLCRDIPKTEK